MSPSERHLAPSAPMLLPERLYHECVCVESESYTCVFSQRRVILYTAQDITCMCDVTIGIYIDFKLTLMSEVEDSI